MSDNKNLIKIWGNDEKRADFLKAYKDWGVFTVTPELGLTYYRYILPCGTSIIALEYKRDPQYFSEGKLGVLYYTMQEKSCFCPGRSSSLWQVAGLLKDAKVKLQQEAKNQKKEVA